ncbi:MAG: ABC transporter ATP-binding protein/permease [Elusimicrobiales bacterium]|nr:ABC transporter ATP-binding protein/permease [Elusimicrobiales bacterium]
MKRKTENALGKTLAFSGRHKRLVYISFVLSAAAAAAGIMPFVYLWRIINDVIQASPDYANATNIVHNGWMAVFFSITAMLVYFAALMCSHTAAFRTASNMKKALLAHIAMLPAGFADSAGTGGLRRIVLETTASTETLLAHNLPDMIQAAVTPLCIIALLFVYDWRFGLCCIIPLLAAFACMMKMAGPGMEDDIKKYQNALEKMSSEAVEYVRGMPVVKTFGQTVFSFHRFKKAIDDYGRFCFSYTMRARMPMIMFTLFINMPFAFLLCLALFLTKGGAAMQDILVNFLFYVIITPVMVTTMNRIMFMSENMMVLNDTVSRVDEVLAMQPLPESRNTAHPGGHTVELSHVTYRYPGKNEAAVKDLSIKAGENTIIALAGRSGSGKTTAAALISRFLDAQEGTVKIGGADVRDIPKKELMNTVSYVFQESRLLKQSIADNLRIARPDASDRELLEALHTAQCDDIISRLPEGINTIIGSKGTYLSGGEKQRITIARAILKNAPVVILDEATAFADPENEALVHKAFTALAEHATVIMIAHRLSSIRNADRIYVLDKGSVAEEGRHEELLKKNGLYSAMWKEYMKAADWVVGDRTENATASKRQGMNQTDRQTTSATKNGVKGR